MGGVYPSMHNLVSNLPVVLEEWEVAHSQNVEIQSDSGNIKKSPAPSSVTAKFSINTMPVAVACTYNPSTLDEEFQNGMGSIPIRDNSPSTGG